MAKQNPQVEEKDRRLKIMWSSNGVFCHSGYSTQSRDILYRLIDDKWKMAHTAFYGLEGGILTVNGLKIYPKLADQWGVDAAMHNGNHWGADATVFFQDSWVLNINILKKIKRPIFYVPVDHDPAPPAVVERMKLAYRIITFSKFGQKMLENAGFASEMIPHGVDTELFRPMNKLAMRKKYGIPPDIFLFGMVSANKDNPPRKSFQRVMDAFAKFHKKHPKSGLFMHTLLEQGGGFNIAQYSRHLGINEKIYHMKPYDVIVTLGSDKIAELINTFDVLLCPSQNEGFGIPIIEAQSCEKPVIVTDWTAMPEHIIEEKTGLKTKVAFKRWTGLGGYVAHPDPDDLYNNMEKIYKMDIGKMGKRARKHILKNYDMNKIVSEKWIPFLKGIQKDIYKGVGINESNKKS